MSTADPGAVGPERILDDSGVRAAVAGMARDVLSRLGPDGPPLALVGIQRRGVDLARMLADAILDRRGVETPIGSVDITLYRDDLMAIGPVPLVGETDLPEGGVDERAIVLVDDVLYTGRTVRAALNELMDWGRPARVLLAVLVDRGGRELPVQADVAGRALAVRPDRRVDVLVPRVDGVLAVELGAGRGG